MKALLEKLPGVATAETNKSEKTATIVYDKSVFDVSSVGDEGRYKFAVKEDTAAGEEKGGMTEMDDHPEGSDKM